jgi:general secretion pathway protein C
MMTLSRTRFGLPAVTLVVWALAAASIVYWGLRLAGGRGPEVSVPVAATPPPVVDTQVVARLLGAVEAAAPQQATLASRFQLQGVLAGTPGGGAALIVVDGKPAQPFRVGAAIEEGLVLQSAVARRARLAATRDGPTLLTLDMPPLKE